MKKRRAWNAWDCEVREKEIGSWTVLVVVVVMVVQRRRAESGRQPSSALRCCVSVVTGRPWLSSSRRKKPTGEGRRDEKGQNNE
ncbi:unnamed protein product [Sphagnum jensenii]|uniref:Uncharacterized protein n=1 Tax=Sphagnum jensenii TaxID=128206 RepID=A0ABP1AGJ2_9BRYO